MSARHAFETRCCTTDSQTIVREMAKLDEEGFDIITVWRSKVGMLGDNAIIYAKRPLTTEPKS